MRVLKFGGSTLKNIASVEKVINIIKHKSQSNQIVVVVSAFFGVTDKILSIIHSNNVDIKKKTFSEIKNLHLEIAEYFLPPFQFKNFQTEVTRLLQPLYSYIQQTSSSNIDEKNTDFLLSFGEKMSALLIKFILSSYSINAINCNADNFLITDNKFGYANVLFAESRTRIRFIYDYLSRGYLPVITGFIGRTLDGFTTTLGRNGSDYSATILAGLLKADIVEIWTDSDGILSADPKLFSAAKWIPVLSINEAKVLSSYKNNVLHSRTIKPLEFGRIPLVIKNVYNPHHPGTLISVKQNLNYRKKAIKSIVIEKDISIITLTLPEKIENSSLNLLIQETLQRLAVPELFYWTGGRYLVLIPDQKKDEFILELGSKLFHYGFNWKIGISASPDTYNFLGMIGENVEQNYTLRENLERFFKERKIKVEPITVGNKKHAIEYIGTFDSNQILKELHSYLFKPETIYLVIAGITGKVGSSLVQFLKDKLYIPSDASIKILGAINSRKMVFKEDGITLENINEELHQGKEKDVALFLKECLKSDKPFIFVDLTSAKEIADFYEKFLLEGIPVVTANKLINSSDSFVYTQIRSLRNQLSTPMFYETNVGAATPIIELLQNLSIAKNSIVKIEAVLSGSLSYIFSQLNEGVLFSEAVKHAIDLGYCESNPLTDLRSVDAKRKLLIILREIGKQIDFSDIEVEQLIPDDLHYVNDSELIAQLKSFDPFWKKKIQNAAAHGHKLIYKAVFENEKASLGVQSVPSSDILAHTTFSENVFRITIQGFENQPLTLIGAGAGPEWTAYGVIKDILKAWNYLLDQQMLAVNEMPYDKLLEVTRKQNNIREEYPLEYTY